MGDSDRILAALVTALIWTLWCVLHSVLNSERVIRLTTARVPWVVHCYRLIYSGIAIVTLVLALWLTPPSRVDALQWRGAARCIQVALWVVALGTYGLSMRIIGLWDFLGLTVFRVFRRSRRKPGVLVTHGIFGEIRHPLYVATLAVLWARDLSETELVIAAVLSAYLLVGARIEERRLLREFGPAYARYMDAVPGFIPRRIPSLTTIIRQSSPRHRADPHSDADR
jgi:methanethiol S-methyltransferase